MEIPDTHSLASALTRVSGTHGSPAICMWRNPHSMNPKRNSNWLHVSENIAEVANNLALGIIRLRRRVLVTSADGGSAVANGESR